MRTWELSGTSPEMEMIEALLRECGEQVAHDSVSAPLGARVIPVADSPRPGMYASKLEILRGSSIGKVIAELARLGALPSNWERVYAPTDETREPGYIFRPSSSFAVCIRHTRDTGVSGASPDGRGLRAVMTIEALAIPESLTTPHR